MVNFNDNCSVISYIHSRIPCSKNPKKYSEQVCNQAGILSLVRSTPGVLFVEKFLQSCCTRNLSSLRAHQVWQEGLKLEQATIYLTANIQYEQRLSKFKPEGSVLSVRAGKHSETQTWNHWVVFSDHALFVGKSFTWTTLCLVYMFNKT